MIADEFGSIVLQPTTLCNLNCVYCYLPERDKNQKMDPSIAWEVAQAIRSQTSDDVVSVVWHGGEPLAVGTQHFENLTRVFEDFEREGRVQHHIQTNATLITPEWCAFFLNHKFKVGISIDGPIWANDARLDWGGKETFNRTIAGIELLKESDVPFTVLAVVSKTNISRAAELYTFFRTLGCYSLGINVEEQEGVHVNGDRPDDDRVQQFWEDLFQAWRQNPTVHIREIDRVLAYAASVLSGGQHSFERRSTRIDPFPTVAWNGDVYLLSPEFAGTRALKYADFMVGNVRDQPLNAIIERGIKSLYVSEFVKGIELCKDECPYFNFCGGGQASNKYFECGTTKATETAFCRNSKIRLVDAVLTSV